MTTLDTPTYERIEIRCPNGAKKLLGIVRKEQGLPVIVDGNLLELPCRECRAVVERKTGKRQSLVVHRYNVIAELVETLAVGTDGDVKVYPSTEVL